MKHRKSLSGKQIWRKVRRQVSILFVMLIILVIPLPFLVLVLIPSLVLRLAVKILARIFRHDLSKIFSGKGIIFALEDIYKRPKVNILLHFICDGPVPVEQFRDQFQERVMNHCDSKGKRIYANLQCTWTQFMGFMFYKLDKEFKLSNHIRLYDYTDPDLQVPAFCTEDDLKRITGPLLAKPWHVGRSPWEILIIPTYSTKNSNGQKVGSVGILKIHHALADGYSILKFMMRFAGKSETKMITANFQKLPLMQRIVRPLVLLLKLPYDCAKFLVDSSDGPNSWHLLTAKYSRKYHVFASDGVPVEKIKEIRRKYGVGYNAAVFSITAGGVRRLMEAAGQKIPKSMSIFVPFPLPKHPGGLVVHVSAICFKFSPRIQSADQRIMEIAKNISSVQKSPTVPIINSWILDLDCLLPIWLVRLTYNKLLASMAMANFPGPEEGIPFLNGTKAVGIIPALGHFAGYGAAAASLVSIAGKQRITLTLDKTIFEGYKVPSDFAQFINEEVEAHLIAKPESV